MEGTIDPFDFYLAEQLHWNSVEQMQDTMSNQEYVAWRAFNAWRNAKAKLDG